ncbi:MAG: recombination mediator RecR [Deltaproteobacteria bacterium]|nr:recombination mediator RecR [Deltaproteobacteria bacterium]
MISQSADPLAELVANLKKLPGVGEKTATRFAYHILNMKKDDILAMANAIKRISDDVKTCSVCFNFTYTDPCDICSSQSRNNSVICVVERPVDLNTIEKAGIFKGRYHVLHGVINMLNNSGPEDIKLAELMNRLAKESVKEVIAALSPTTEGEATALYLQRIIKPMGIKVTRLASGIPMGSALEYVDQYTLTRAMENRTEI